MQIEDTVSEGAAKTLKHTAYNMVRQSCCLPCAIISSIQMIYRLALQSRQCQIRKITRNVIQKTGLRCHWDGGTIFYLFNKIASDPNTAVYVFGRHISISHLQLQVQVVLAIDQ